MSRIRVVPWCVEEHEDPGSPGPINTRQVSLEPLVLIRLGVKVRIRSQHDDVDLCHVERVVQVGRGPTFLVWHLPP